MERSSSSLTEAETSLLELRNTALMKKGDGGSSGDGESGGGGDKSGGDGESNGGDESEGDGKSDFNGKQWQRQIVVTKAKKN